MRLSLPTLPQFNAIRAALFICVLLTQSCLGEKTAAPTPESFVRTLIQHEQRASRGDEEAQAGLRGAEGIYTSGLIALMRKDRNSTPRGDVGNLDFDPICNCQDPDGLQLAALAVTNVDATHASVLATLKFPGEPQPRTVRYFLLHTAVGWRIDDINTSDIPSLRKFLQHGH